MARCRLAELAFAVALGVTAQAQDTALPVADDWYPRDITPPAGTRYPCALTPLPRSLPGIPESDRRYVNHVYTLLLRATQAKLVLLAAMEGPRDVEAAHVRYREQLAEQTGRLAKESVPAGLEAFHADVGAALALQGQFFEAAVPARIAGRTMAEVYAIPAGRTASGRLIAAWGRMQARYPGWPAETRDSVYHHLCALDLF
jgi:hypothetical protein